MTDEIAKLGFDIDTATLVNAQNAATNLAAALGNVAAAAGGPSGVANAVGAATRSVTTLTGYLGPMAASVGLVAGAVTGLASAYSGLALATYGAQERFLLLEARLKNVYGSASIAADMFRKVGQMADQSGVGINAAADAFLRLARNNEAIGLTRSQMLDLTESVQKLGRISNASTGELASGMLQFSQALAAGRLNGDELRSIMENMPALAKAIAEGLNVSVGAMRAMGAAGELTGDKITGALLGQLPKIRKEFESLPQTSEQSFTRVGNAFDKLLAGIGDRLKSSQFVTSIASGIASGVEMAAEMVRRKTAEERVAELRAIEDEFLGLRMQQSFGTINPMGQARLGILDRQMRTVAQERQRLETELLNSGLDSAAREGRDTQRAPFVRSQSIVKELDDVSSKQKKLREEVSALETSYRNFRANPGLFDEREVEALEKFPAYIALMKRQLEDALYPVQAFRKETDQLLSDLEQFGTGGAASIGAEVRKLLKTDPFATEADARSAVIGRRASVDMAGRTGDLQFQIQQQRELVSVIGRGVAAEQELEAQQKALNLQMQLFGRDLTPGAEESMARYTRAMRELLAVQRDLNDQQKLYASQQQLVIERTILQAIAAGRTAGEVSAMRRELEAQRDIRQITGPGAPVAARGGAAALPAGVEATISTVAEAIVQQFGVRITSGLRPNSFGSQHQLGKAIDVDLSMLSPEQKAQLYQQILGDIRSGTGPYAGVRGIGTYDSAGNLLHLDTRQRNAAGVEGGFDVWGPGNTRANLGQTPAAFQELARALFALGSVAGGAGGVGGAGVQDRLVQRDIQLTQAQQEGARREEELRRQARQAEERARARDPVELAAIQRRQQIDDAALAIDPTKRQAVQEAQLAALTASQREALLGKVRGEEETTRYLEQQVKAYGLIGDEQKIALEMLRIENELRQQGIVLDERGVALVRAQAAARIGAQNDLDKARQQARAYEEIWTRSASSIGSAMEGALRDSIMGAEIDAKRMLKSILADIATAMLRATVTTPFQQMVSDFSKSFSFSGLFASANGNVFEGGQVRYFANGGVINSPRFFPMANGGTGVAGEAGPEAILPLKRDSMGRLGVGGGTGGGNINFVVNDMRTAPGAQPVEAEDTMDSNGQRTIQLFVRDEIRRAVREGDVDREMRGSFGLSRMINRR